MPSLRRDRSAAPRARRLRRARDLRAAGSLTGAHGVSPAPAAGPRPLQLCRASRARCAPRWARSRCTGQPRTRSAQRRRRASSGREWPQGRSCRGVPLLDPLRTKFKGGRGHGPRVAHPILRDEGRAPDVDRDHGAAHELGPERAGERSPPANASAGCAAPGVPAPHGPAPVRAEAGVQQAVHVRARAPAVHMCMLMRVRALGRQPGPTGLCHREAQHGEGHGRERCRARRRRAGRHLPREQAEGELCVGQGKTVTNSFAHNRDRDPVAPGSALWRICEPTQEPRHGRENEVNKFLARQTKS